VEVGLDAGATGEAAADGVQAEQGLGLDDVAGLLLHLADRRVDGVLGVVDTAPGKRPARPLGPDPSDEQHLPVIDTDRVRGDP
jgi:hypothetical protein